MGERDAVRIAYIVESYGQVSETFITQLVAGLAALGSSLRVLVDSILSGIELPPRSVQIEETGYCDRWRAIRVWLGRMGRVLGLRDLDAWLARAVARRSLFPAIRRFQPDVAYVEYGFNAILARQALMEAGVPFVVHFHGLDASAKLARNEYRAEIRKVFEDAQAVIVASRHILRRLILAGCPQTKIRIVRHEVSLANLPVIRWEERKKAPPSVIHIGRLVEKKSPLSLLYAFAIARRQVPTATLTVIGEGPLRRAVSETIGLLGLEGCVRVRGAQPHRRVIEELQSHWVYAQHSVTASDGDQEGFSIVFQKPANLRVRITGTNHLTYGNRNRFTACSHRLCSSRWFCDLESRYACFGGLFYKVRFSGGNERLRSETVFLEEEFVQIGGEFEKNDVTHLIGSIFPQSVGDGPLDFGRKHTFRSDFALRAPKPEQVQTRQFVFVLLASPVVSHTRCRVSNFEHTSLHAFPERSISLMLLFFRELPLYRRC